MGRMMEILREFRGNRGDMRGKLGINWGKIRDNLGENWGKIGGDY